MDREYLVKNPVAPIQRVKQSPRAIRTFTRKELYLVFKYASPTNLPYYQLLLITGLRDGELWNLEWTDVDLLNKQLFVCVKQDWKAKSEQGRVVPIGKNAHDVLSNLSHIGSFVFVTRNQKRRVSRQKPWSTPSPRSASTKESS